LRLLFVSDIHYPVDYKVMHRLMEAAKDREAVIVIAGDVTAGGYLHHFEKFLRLMSQARLVLVAGNHDLWLSKKMIKKGYNSLHKLEKISQLCRKYGAKLLDTEKEPLEMGGAALVGSVGWYDYSYAQGLGYTREDFERGTPYKGCEKSLRGPLPPCPAWHNDKVYVKLPFPDEEYVRRNIAQMEKKIRAAEKKGLPVYLILHHVPRQELVKYTGNPKEDFFKAYEGSPKLGELAEKHRKTVKAVFYGHIHDPNAKPTTINGIKYINTYPSLRTQTIQIKI